MSIKDELIYTLAIFAGTILVIGTLSSCAHQTKTLNISCFANDEAKKAKEAVEGVGPVMAVNGTVLFYDEDGALLRIKDGVCGIK
jgi:hypothetical protein